MDLPPALAAIAEAELGETPETRATGLKDLRAKIELLPEDKRPHRLDDLYLLAFLRHAKFRVKKAYTRIMNMEKYRQEHWELIKDVKAEDFREGYAQGWMRILSKHGAKGHQITLLVPSKFPDKLSLEWLIKWNWWSIQRCITDVNLQVLGQVVCEDFEDFSFLKMIGFGSEFNKVGSTSFKFTNTCVPLRIGGIYILNQPAFIGVLMALARPFMSKKMLSRVRLFGADKAALAELVGGDVLPPEFGGTNTEDPMAWLEEQAALEALGQDDTPAAPGAQGGYTPPGVDAVPGGDLTAPGVDAVPVVKPQL